MKTNNAAALRDSLIAASQADNAREIYLPAYDGDLYVAFAGEHAGFGTTRETEGDTVIGATQFAGERGGYWRVIMPSMSLTAEQLAAWCRFRGIAA